MWRLVCGRGAASLQGYRVLGVHMVNWDGSDEKGAAVCPQTEDLKSATAVCQHLNIPLTKVWHVPSQCVYVCTCAHVCVSARQSPMLPCRCVQSVYV